jgi:hypothetical protein
MNHRLLDSLLIRRCAGVGAFLALTIDLASQGPAVPNRSQGSVSATGKFVPANPASSVSVSAEKLKESAASIEMKEDESIFRLGQIVGDRKSRTLSIPVKLNAREGLIEYALVTTTGKVHEALLSTEVSPSQIQVAALLLGLAPQKSGEPGNPVSLELEWETNGPRRILSLGEMVAPAKGGPETRSPMPLGGGDWIFQGSVLDAQGFAAEREGSVISLIGDAAALIGNPKADAGLNYYPHPPALPPSGLPLTLRIRAKAAAK